MPNLFEAPEAPPQEGATSRSPPPRWVLATIWSLALALNFLFSLCALPPDAPLGAARREQAMGRAIASVVMLPAVFMAITAVVPHRRNRRSLAIAGLVGLAFGTFLTCGQAAGRFNERSESTGAPLGPPPNQRLQLPGHRWAIPVPWVAAGFGDTNPPRLTMEGVSVVCFLGVGGCADTNGASDASYRLVPQIQIDTGAFSFSADLVSEIDGNAWTFGYRNVELTTLPLSSDPDVLGPDELGLVSLQLMAGYFATFSVPQSSRGAFADLIFAATELGPREGFLQSNMFGLGPLPGIGTVERFLSGDQLTFFSSSNSTYHLASASNTQSGMIEQSSFSSCGRQLALLDLSDCTITLSVFQVVPEPSLTSLVCVAVGALLLGRTQSRGRKQEQKIHEA